MIYAPPELSDADRAVLDLIAEVGNDLRFYLVQPRRWFGTLRRTTVARAVQGSNSIEGYQASVEDVAAVMEGEPPLDADEETSHAIAGYRDAMTYVVQLAPGPVTYDESLVRSLHFMMLKYDLAKHPGRWRPGAIWIEDPDGKMVYQAPDRDQVEELMAETLAQMNDATLPVMVRAAMAHLNLTLVHPFSDGNGRMARCLQTSVLASAGVVSPEFSSIEEYLGRHTAQYYDVLTEVAQGEWSPHRDPYPWVRFCLTAHYRQAQTLLRRVHETEALWDRCEELVVSRGLPARSVTVLCDAARGWQLRRSLYIKVIRTSTGEEITDATATRDLRALAEAGLLQPTGEKRARRYLPAESLRSVWRSIRAYRARVDGADPYDLIRD